MIRLSGESLGEPRGASVASFSAQGEPSGVAFNPAGTELAVSSLSGAVTVFDALTAHPELSLPNASTEVTSVAYSADGRYL
jgi:DNA-binding beta-propeller fold protein YncE